MKVQVVCKEAQLTSTAAREITWDLRHKRAPFLAIHAG